MNQLLSSIRSFAIEDDGAQIVEYSLIIAVISIALVLAIQGLTNGSYFSQFITRVGNCLTGAAACA